MIEPGNRERQQFDTNYLLWQSTSSLRKIIETWGKEERKD